VNDDGIKELLANADKAAGPPAFGHVRAAGIRARLRRRRMIVAGFPAAAAAVLLALGVWCVCTRTTEPAPQDERRIASLEEQVRQLQVQTEAALKLVQNVLAQEREQQRLDALEAELASIRDPREEMEAQADRAAFALVYEADRFYRELNQAQSAVEVYEQVIRLFPQSRWADEARKRLAEIRTQRANQI
jgi:tetratricopeptide (TPR) repeat protein